MNRRNFFRNTAGALLIPLVPSITKEGKTAKNNPVDPRMYPLTPKQCYSRPIIDFDYYCLGHVVLYKRQQAIVTGVDLAARHLIIRPTSSSSDLGSGAGVEYRLDSNGPEFHELHPTFQQRFMEEHHAVTNIPINDELK